MKAHESTYTVAKIVINKLENKQYLCMFTELLLPLNGIPFALLLQRFMSHLRIHFI